MSSSKNCPGKSARQSAGPELDDLKTKIQENKSITAVTQGYQTSSFKLISAFFIFKCHYYYHYYYYFSFSAYIWCFYLNFTLFSLRVQIRLYCRAKCSTIKTFCYTNFSLYSSFYNVKSYTNLSLMVNEQKMAIQNFQMNLHPVQPSL